MNKRGRRRPVAPVPEILQPARQKMNVPEDPVGPYARNSTRIKFLPTTKLEGVPDE